MSATPRAPRVERRRRRVGRAVERHRPGVGRAARRRARSSACSCRRRSRRSARGPRPAPGPRSTPSSATVAPKRLRMSREGEQQAGVSGYFRYSGDRAGRAAAHLAASSMFSGVTTCTPVSITAGDLLALQVLHHRLHREIAHLERVLQDEAVHLALALHRVDEHLAARRSRRSCTLPARPRSCSASSMPAADDSLTAEDALQIAAVAVEQVLGRALGGVARRPGVLVRRDDGRCRDTALQRLEEALLARLGAAPSLPGSAASAPCPCRRAACPGARRRACRPSRCRWRRS